MLCPVCLREVSQFTEEEVDGALLLSCPHRDCGYDIPLAYRNDFASHPPLAFSLIGLTGHGKTIFKDSFLHEVEHITSWPGFYYNWLDEIRVRDARRSLAELEAGQLQEATPEEFRPPQILRLSDVPRLGGCQLLIFDCGGEVWLDGLKIRDGGRYVRHSPAVVWLISLTDLKSPAELNDMLDIYLHALATMQVDPKEQSIVFTLTKGDLLLNKPDFPEPAKEFLFNDDLDPAGDAWTRLQAVSDVLEAWLEQNGFQKMVNTAKSRFRSAHYCVVSALGAPAGQQQTDLAVMPRGVLAPLFWLWRLQRPGVWLDVEGGRSLYFSLPEALADAPDGATLELEAGIYRLDGPLNVRRSVRFVGTGMDETVLSVAAERWGLGISVEERASLEDLTVELAGEAAGDVTRVVRGQFEAVGCRFRHGRGDDKASGAGLVLAGDATGVVAECVFNGNQRHGLVLRDRAKFRIEGCKAARNGLTGIYCESAEACLLAENECSNNRHGIWAKGAGAVTVEGNHCHHNDKTGLRLEGAQGAVRENRLLANGRDGLEVGGSGGPAVAKNVCDGNGENGIRIEGDVQGNFEENTCKGNKQAGIRVAGAARPELVKNLAETNAGPGILLTEAAGGACRENTCKINSGDGIRVDGSATPDVTANQCESNTGDGIAVHDQAKPAVEQNACSRNAGNGLTLAKGTKPRALRRNTGDGNRGKLLNDQRPWL